MRRTFIVGAAVALLAGAWAGSSLRAQERRPTRPKSVLLIDQIDELGRTIFGGILSPFTPKARRELPADPDARPTRYAKRPSLVRIYGEKTGEPRPATSPIGPTRSPASTVPKSKPDHWRDSGYSLIRPGEAESAVPGVSAPGKQLSEPAAPATSAADHVSHPAPLKLHERLMALRQSPFDDLSEPEGAASTGPETPSQSQPAIRQPTPASAGRSLPASNAEDQPGPRANHEPPPPAASRPAEQEKQPSVSAASSVAPRQAAAAPADDDDDVLITRGSPTLDVRTVGPRRITVGKPSSFVLSITNSGPVAADQAVVTVELPEWADVVGSKSSVGTTGWSESTGSSRHFRWAVGRLGARGHEELTLDIVPRRSQPFDLAVKWDYKPVASEAVIEVQEPKIELKLDGPHEILYGAREVYRLELHNSGTGDAENVEISLAPVDRGNSRPATHKVGLVPAGTTKAVEVELTARQAGRLTVQVEARGDGGVASKLVEEIVVVRPALQVRIDAPEVQYLNAVAEYTIRVSNPGTAPAKNVAVTAAIPPGARLESSVPHGALTPGANEVTWTLDSLAAGEEKTLRLSCTLEQPGTRQLTVRSAAEGDLRAAAEATTLVQTMPDLVLDLKDPVGPIRVGEEATYHVAIQNRGTESAQGVEVVVYFSRGIEPTAAEGAGHRIGSGQVVFDKIASLGVGEHVALEVRAKAETAGNHICRVEVHCKASGIRLVSEEMTPFYAGESRPQHAELDTAGPADDVVRTAERSSPSGGHSPTDAASPAAADRR